MVTGGKNKIGYISRRKMPGSERAVGSNGLFQIGSINNSGDAITGFGLLDPLHKDRIQHFIKILQIAGSPDQKIFRDRDQGIEIAEVIIKFLSTVIRISVPSVNIIIHSNAWKEISHKSSAGLYFTGTYV